MAFRLSEYLKPIGKRGLPAEGEGVDRIGVVETRGVEFIPDSERHSRPLNIFWIFVGGQFAFSIVVLGWLPISFGLGWWSAVSSTLLGIALSCLIMMWMAAVGMRAGTNSAVASGAYFGVVGRLVGSVIACFINVGFIALSAWTGGQMVVAGAHRLLSTPESTGAYAISYVLIMSVIFVAAIYGHASMVFVEKVLIPTAGLMLMAGWFIFAHKFHANYHGGHYILGTFWATWALSVTTAAAGIGYGTIVNDWTRYISPIRWKTRNAVIASGLGLFVSEVITVLFGTYTATMLHNPTGDYIPGLAQISPMWYLPFLIIVGIIGSYGQGTLCLYSSGLDTSSLIPFLRRVAATVLIAVVSLALIFLGSLVWNVVNSVTSFVTILVMFSTPWIVIISLGHWLRKGRYAVNDLQVFNRGERGGLYWFTGGVNLRAVVAWVVGCAAGMMFSGTTLYTGPGVSLTSGVDISWLVAGAVGGLVYIVGLTLFPEPRELRDPAVIDAHNAAFSQAASYVPNRDAPLVATTPPISGPTPLA